jgi:hypothetical protein
MGLISNLIAYKVGKRSGRRTAERRAAREAAEESAWSGAGGAIDREDCVNYQSFCKNFGGCDGQVCEFDDD